MTENLGFDSWVSFVPESTWGTAPGAGEVYSRLVDESMKLVTSPKFFPSVSGPGRRKKFMGHRRVSGDVVIETLRQGVFPLLLKNGFGAVVTSGAGPFTHTFAMAALPTGLNLEVSKADTPTGQVFRFDGCLIDRLTIDFAAEEMLQCSVGLIAKDRTTGVTASGTPVYPADEPLLFSDAGQLTVAGTAIDIKSGTFVINNNLDPERFFMSQLISRPKRRTFREVTGTALVSFEDLTLVDKFGLGTEGVMTLLFTDGPDSFQMDMAASFLSEGEPMVNTEGELELNLAFQAVGSDLLEATAVLINDQATIP